MSSSMVRIPGRCVRLIHRSNTNSNATTTNAATSTTTNVNNASSVRGLSSLVNANMNLKKDPGMIQIQNTIQHQHQYSQHSQQQHNHSHSSFSTISLDNIPLHSNTDATTDATTNNTTDATNTNNNTDSNNTATINTNDNNTDDYEEPLHPEAYNPIQTQQNILKAAQWNQGTGTQGKWNPQFCHGAVMAYTQHLKYILALKQNTNETVKVPSSAVQTLLSSHTTERALKAMIKMNLETHHLSKSVRDLEKLIGTIALTPLTDRLSLRLLEANGKAGNIGRTLSLLQLRKSKNYKPLQKEIHYAIQSILSAGLYLRKGNRNLFLKENQQPEIDNPTRWLDAILVNMNERGVELDTKMANRMLDCYCSTGRSGKALHFFYKVTREYFTPEGGSVAVAGSGGSIPNKMEEVSTGGGAATIASADKIPVFDDRKAKVRMRMKQHMPPYYKLPSDVKLNGDLVKRPNKEGLIPRIEWEKEKNFSLSLTAAFAFADSLTHGACGHNPIKLDLTSWNILIKACCYRGALWRALDILNNTLPKNKIKADSFSYNTILGALARVGDKDFMREMLTTMTNSNVPLDKYTVQALVDGYLNAGDISGAVTLVQDMFNQHHILPPYTTHLKIIEFALGNDLVYEAKRQVYFIQQLWKYSPREGDSEEFRKVVFLTQKNPKLAESSLKRLFQYFGEELKDEDFF